MKIVEVAKSQLDTREAPPGSNNVKYNTWYYGRQVSGDFPWCSVFVAWCFNEAGLMNLTPYTNENKYTRNASKAFNWLNYGGNVLLSPKQIRMGDVVVYTFSHVGIASTDSNSKGDFKAIEGNTDEAGGRTGGKVMEKTRNISLVKGVYRPNYNIEEEEMTDAQKQALDSITPKYQFIDNNIPYGLKDELQEAVDLKIISYGPQGFDPKLSDQDVRFAVIAKRAAKI